MGRGVTTTLIKSRGRSERRQHPARGQCPQSSSRHRNVEHSLRKVTPTALLEHRVPRVGWGPRPAHTNTRRVSQQLLSLQSVPRVRAFVDQKPEEEKHFCARTGKVVRQNYVTTTCGATLSLPRGGLWTNRSHLQGLGGTAARSPGRRQS